VDPQINANIANWLCTHPWWMYLPFIDLLWFMGAAGGRD
jgi:hypothetical protein